MYVIFAMLFLSGTAIAACRYYYRKPSIVLSQAVDSTIVGCR